MTPGEATASPGRGCPTAYRYAAPVFDRPPHSPAGPLYWCGRLQVMGGVGRLVDLEQRRLKLLSLMPRGHVGEGDDERRSASE